MRRLPLTVQTAYSDLLQRLQEDALIETGGAPVERTVRGRRYWYTRTLIGGREVQRYLGPDSPQMRERIEAARRINEDLRERDRARRQLVEMLKGRSIPGIDRTTGKVLAALAKAGLFRLRAVLVGTHAFRLYPLILGVEIAEAHAVTEDIDVAQSYAIALALDDRPDPAIEEALRAVGQFAARPTLHHRSTAYRASDSGAVVEFLTPNPGPDCDEPVELPALGVYAQPLRFLDFLIRDAMPAAVPYRYGVLVNVPQPAHYAVHKLIVASRRAQGAAAKARKDIEQAAALVRILAEDQPDELADAWVEAREVGPAWREALGRGVRRLPKDAAQALELAIGEQARSHTDGDQLSG